MSRTKLLIASLVVALPVAAALGIRTVKGSEPPGRLVDNGDGTVTDTVTRLMWQKDGSTIVSNQATAVTTCAALDAGAAGGAWRVPNVKELVTIVDYESQTAPTIDTAVFTGTNAGSNEPYYTSSSTICVLFANGSVGTNECTTGNPVRCVRSLLPDGGV
jgi:hypothetical protein